ncbi:MAG TPA: hypothetical protein VJ304_06695, partial [Flavobacterium sp.]|nr:hypothetical protein [Flavobacterium sp.]
KTYGIDFLKSYECPLVDDTVKNILVSVKYHKDKYPDGYKALAKSHLIELSQMLHSYSYSELKSDTEHLEGSIEEDIGVLIWLCHKDSDLDIRKELQNTRIELPYDQTKIILLDNIQVDFVWSAVSFIKTVFVNQGIEFYYPNTGQNINPMTKISSGKIMPVEFVCSPVITFKTSDSNKIITLSIITSVPFTKSNLRRIIGLAQELTTNLSSQILLAFPDYDELEHQNDFLAIKNEFTSTDLANKVFIANYSNTRYKIK